jgi:hypothetical protein
MSKETPRHPNKTRAMILAVDREKCGDSASEERREFSG